ncbi:MAG: hypothetical protein K9H64_05725 [Bacteroidales bacterium]|nr:hypothetical protein [Bacteroidales bacterium]MCF8458542.1 hypothetical protein [Bacteroidales bacterium]
MNTATKRLIIDEIDNLPDNLAQELLDFIKNLRFTKRKEKILTAVASEEVLSKDWLSPEEEEVWRDLYFVAALPEENIGMLSKENLAKQNN